MQQLLVCARNAPIVELRQIPLTHIVTLATQLVTIADTREQRITTV